MMQFYKNREKGEKGGEVSNRNNEVVMKNNNNNQIFLKNCLYQGQQKTLPPKKKKDKKKQRNSSVICPLGNLGRLWLRWMWRYKESERQQVMNMVNYGLQEE